MIWNYIYEFFVQYIFGGIIGNHFYQTVLTYDGNGVPKYNYDTSLRVWGLDFTAGNYLSLIATIICMILIVIFCIWLVRWVFKVVTSAMLLK